MIESKIIAVVVDRGDEDGKEAVASVSFCESSVSLTVGKQTIHLPWRELATWQAWLAERIHKEE